MFIRPTLQTLIDRTKNDLESRLNTAGAVLRRAVIAVIARVLAGASHLMHGHLDFIADQVFPDKAITPYLKRWGSIWNISPLEATYASGFVQHEGVNGTVIVQGTIWRRADGVEYESLAEETVSDGVAEIEIEAVEAGENGNCDAATELTLLSPIAGVNSAGAVAEDGITGGNDEESEESHRSRLLDRIQRPPLGGAFRDYEKWAREVSGVTRVWVYPEWLGAGTVGVSFVRDNDDDIFPNPASVEDVQDHIDIERPVTANVTVFAPTPDLIDYSIRLAPDNSEARAAVQAELEDLHYRDGEPGGTILLSRMNEAISIAAGEADHTLESPTEDYESEAGYLPRLGEITWL